MVSSSRQYRSVVLLSPGHCLFQEERKEVRGPLPW